MDTNVHIEKKVTHPAYLDIQHTLVLMCRQINKDLA